MKVALRVGIIASLCGPVATAWAAETITFDDGIAPGQIIDVIFLPGVGEIQIQGIRPGMGDDPTDNFAITFPSNAPPGLDFDLGSPNNSCGGPGVSSDGSGVLGGPFPNCEMPDGPIDPADPLNNVLIVAANLDGSEGDGIVDVPNDNASDNELIFKFIDRSVRFSSITLLDIEEPPGETARIMLYEDLAMTQLIADIPLEEPGDNGLRIFNFDPFEDARAMIVDLNGSGAIDNIVLGFCGDGELDPGEDCDDGNDIPDDGCTDCTVDNICGDGEVGDDEECDDGNDIPDDGCTDCTVDNICGDGEVGDDEECDEGDDNSNDPCASCREDCTTPDCGDGIADVGCSDETCDGDDLANTACDSCRGSDSPAPCTCCGDGEVQGDAGEECDDGNLIDGDGCDSSCLVEQGGGEGCTPGYWKQAHHFCNWPEGYDPDDAFSAHFDDAFPGMTLLEVLWQGGGGLKALGRHTVAALLNAASEVNYDMGAQDVIDDFNAAYDDGEGLDELKDELVDLNEQGCPLGNCGDGDDDGDEANAAEGGESVGHPSDGRARGLEDQDRPGRRRRSGWERHGWN